MDQPNSGNASGLNHEIYEQQLSQLEGQLVDSMMRNEALVDELTQLKEENKKLLQRMDRSLSPPTPPSAGSTPSRNSVIGGLWTPGAASTSGAARESIVQRIQSYGKQKWAEFKEDISVEEEEDLVLVGSDEEEEPLSMKLLKMNVSRFKRAIKPFRFTIQLVGQTVQWKNPAASSLLFVSCLLFLYYGILLSALFFSGAAFLTYCYFVEAGIVKSGPFGYAVEDEPDSDPSMRDRVAIMLTIARRVQNLLGDITTVLEKIANMFSWKNPDATRKLRNLFLLLGVVLLVLPGSVVGSLFGLNIIMQIFVLKPLFAKFPKLKRKYDSFGNFFASIPSNAELAMSYSATSPQARAAGATPSAAALMSDSISISSDDTVFISSPDDSKAKAKKARKEQHLKEQFSFEHVELVANWHCVLLNKSSRLTGHKKGKMYLTTSHLVFEPTSALFASVSEKDKLLIELSDIASIRKAKPIAFVPGEGFSIEVVLNDSNSILFGGLIHRDETFTAIVEYAASINLNWGKAALASLKEAAKDK